MQITRNNAEAFFLDYYEGNLSERQVEEMFAFLKTNPDLREVFESFGDVTVNADSISAPDFSFLKKEDVADEHALAEQWMVDYVDGVITEEDRLSLETYLTANPSKRSDLAILEKTILQADGEESFGDLSSLKKPVNITAENFDDYAVALVEGFITTEEKDKLDTFVAADSEYKAQLENYQQTKLKADDEIKLVDKSFLKKTGLVVNDENIAELLVAKSEGVLSDYEEEVVSEYITRFPEYKRELEQLSRTKFSPDESIVFEGKDQLKRGSFQINDSNFEQYLIASVEEQLNSEELAAFNAFVTAHPKYRKVVSLYAATRLRPDMAVVYEDKEELKRRAGGAWWSVSIRYAAAAVVVLLLGIYLWTKFGASTGDVPVDNFANNTDKNEVVPEFTEPGNDKESINPVDDNQPKIATYVPGQSGDADLDGIQKKEATPFVIVDNSFVPVTIVADHISNEANDAVNFNGELYDVMFNTEVQPTGNRNDKYITPGQYAMRWMKEKLDGPEPTVVAGNNDAGDGRPVDENIDGLDLTESAVNRVGDATGGNVSMDRRTDGTYLHLWKYSVRVSQKF